MITITMLATLCHMASVSPGMPAVEFCEEVVVAERVEDIDPRDKAAKEAAVGVCYNAAQMTIAQRLMPGFTVHAIRCSDGHDGQDKPRNAI